MAENGRPTKFKDIDLNQVKSLAVKGWTDNEMAAFFDIDRSTWYRWKNKHPEFCDALKGWKEFADQIVERSLFERAIGYSHPEDKIFNNNGVKLVVPTMKHYPPDTTAAIFWLKNRDRENWRDVQDRNHTGTIGHEVYELSETERSARIAALLESARSRRDAEVDNNERSDVDTTRGAAE